MIKQDGIEGNMLIAEFMGFKKRVINDPLYNQEAFEVYDDVTWNDSFGAGTFEVSSLSFHTSWDWLMPVVEKIEGLGYDSTISGDSKNSHSCYFSEGTPQGDSGKYFTIRSEAEAVTTKIEAVWLAIVHFIKWYNQNN